MTLRTSSKQLVAEALTRVDTVSVDDARRMLNAPDIVFVDIRETGELKRDGTIPGAFHAPRGMLEFWVDPDSPYYKPIFGGGKRFVFFCNSAWRSALATAALQNMGFDGASHLEGGFAAWKKAGGEVAEWTKGA